ncbi:Gluconolactonase precursor [Planctomycetes bacterium CA13]|uniref:Gluconolactonase n=1 Tax=Novipirellula herctigrandis TaxID=2527986 RepID=A0A5C5YVK1_9BACT|nr:Gluconolactonase precursor [Planctomycetes bacterium CA13]
MRHVWFFVCVAIFCSFTVVGAEETIGRIESLDSGFAELVPATAKIEVLAEGFSWIEGPVWVPDETGGHLLFSDIPQNSIFRWSKASGATLYMKPSGFTGLDSYGREPGSNGLALDGEGRLIACEHGDRRVSQLTEGGGKITLADRYKGNRLNSPNDLAIDSTGVIYFTDPPYGLPKQMNDPRCELDFCGVYRLDVDRTLTLLTKQFTRPNGIGLSPDEKTLYVAQSDSKQPVWMAFSIGPNKTINEGAVLYDATDAAKTAPGMPDGMAVHSGGAIFGSGPGGVYVISPSGKLLGRIFTGGRVSNCTFNDDESVLYLTADHQLCCVRLK